MLSISSSLKQMANQKTVLNMDMPHVESREGRFRLDTWKKFFTMRVMRH